MSFNVIFFLMLSTLLGLIFYSRIYRKKEKKLMEVEVSYIEDLTHYKNNPVEDLKTNAVNKGKAYGELLGLSSSETEIMINNDLLRFTK
jgi:hypothetical protein